MSSNIFSGREAPSKWRKCFAVGSRPGVNRGDKKLEVCSLNFKTVVDPMTVKFRCRGLATYRAVYSNRVMDKS